jgi:hypothetical protein
LTGKTNVQVAAFYLSQFRQTGLKLNAQVLDTALDVYVTTLSLGGTAGQAAGFKVTGEGLGAYSVNVGANGAAFGVANNTSLNVYQILKAANQQARNGRLYNGDTRLRQKTYTVFAGINEPKED